MARFQGGPFSRASGKIGDIVLGAARTRDGKVMTGRSKVKPTYTNVPAQATQRTRFKQAQLIIRAIGYAIYNAIFNRAIAQLPGWNSLQSILSLSMDDSFDLSAPVETNLGTLHFPITVTATASALSGTVTVTYSNENGDNGDETDLFETIVIPQTATKRAAIGNAFTSDGSATRDDGSDNVGGLALTAGDHFIVGLYAQGKGQYNNGMLTVVKWYDVTTGT